MVGLSVILENYREVFAKRSNIPQVIFKGSTIKPPSSPTDHYIPPNINLCRDSWFLHSCFLCNKKLLSGKDIYMYKGDRAFCSEDCRCRQILMDEEESSPSKNGYTSTGYNSCSFSVVKRPQTVAAGGATTSSPPSSRSGGGKGPRNTSNVFAY